MGGQIDEWMDGSLLRKYTLILVHKKIKCRKQQEKDFYASNFDLRGDMLYSNKNLFLIYSLLRMSS